MSDDPIQFEGFARPESNYTRIPNEWFSIQSRITSLAEMKVVEYIMRHTWGYQEYGIRKLISLNDFMHGRKRRDGTRIDQGTGLSVNSVRQGIALALQHGLIEEEVDGTDKARLRRYYAVRMLGPQATIIIKDDQMLDPRLSHSDRAPVSECDPGLSECDSRTKKETLERNLVPVESMRPRTSIDSSAAAVIEADPWSEQSIADPGGPVVLPIAAAPRVIASGRPEASDERARSPRRKTQGPASLETQVDHPPRVQEVKQARRTKQSDNSGHGQHQAIVGAMLAMHEQYEGRQLPQAAIKRYVRTVKSLDEQGVTADEVRGCWKFLKEQDRFYQHHPVDLCVIERQVFEWRRHRSPAIYQPVLNVPPVIADIEWDEHDMPVVPSNQAIASVDATYAPTAPVVATRCATRPDHAGGFVGYQPDFNQPYQAPYVLGDDEP